jgi:hypothetical protein
MATGEAASVSGDRLRYTRRIRWRLRTANLAAWMRAGGIQIVWLTILVAGAAIPVSDVLIDSGWEWVSPVLGFIVVIAAGLERIFSRTTPAAAALDELRRNLAREYRIFLAAPDDHDGGADRFDRYVERSEALVADYDQKMIDYNARVVRASP